MRSWWRNSCIDGCVVGAACSPGRITRRGANSVPIGTLTSIDGELACRQRVNSRSFFAAALASCRGRFLGLLTQLERASTFDACQR